MNPKVRLNITEGRDKGKSFTFEEHDTFILGRMADCHVCIADDEPVSRHHFLLEVCPLSASLRDLGSLNDTHVNGQKHGGREKSETPEQAAKQRYPEVELGDGDEVKVGPRSDP